jgi:hypothetical protein
MNSTARAALPSEASLIMRMHYQTFRSVSDQHIFWSAMTGSRASLAKRAAIHPSAKKRLPAVVRTGVPLYLCLVWPSLVEGEL